MFHPSTFSPHQQNQAKTIPVHPLGTGSSQYVNRCMAVLYFDKTETEQTCYGMSAQIAYDATACIGRIIEQLHGPCMGQGLLLILAKFR